MEFDKKKLAEDLNDRLNEWIGQAANKTEIDPEKATSFKLLVAHALAWFIDNIENYIVED